MKKSLILVFLLISSGCNKKADKAESSDKKIVIEKSNKSLSTKKSGDIKLESSKNESKSKKQCRKQKNIEYSLEDSE